MKYSDFLESKKPRVQACGIEPGPINPTLFGWQADIVKWALRRGRAALFEDCGLGKTFQQVEWARQIQDACQDACEGRVLIVAPLSVAQQTIEEATKLGVDVVYKAEPDDSAGIWITNYQRLHKFAGVEFVGIVLDESSILKSLDGKTRTLLLKQFTRIPYRLCCTATPAPNDLAELANHAEFLGAMPRVEMLATFFVHDSERSGSDGWRLKGHAKDDFWRWVAQWAVYIRKPSDLGYPDGAFQLPALNIRAEVVQSDFKPDGALFAGLSAGIQGRTQARRATMADRVRRAAEIIKESWKIKHTSKNTTSEIEKRDLLPQRNTGGQTEISGSPICGNITEKINSGRASKGRSEDGQIPKKQKLEEELTTKRIERDTSDVQENGTRLTLAPSETERFSEPTEYRSPNTSNSPLSRAINAQSVDLSQNSQLTTKRSTSTMTTDQGLSGDCSVQPATSLLDSCKMIPSSLAAQSPTCSLPQWIVWVKLNDEGAAISKALGDMAVEISGRDSDESKIEKELRWRNGEVPVLITKLEIGAWGLNWQHCRNVLYLGLGDSFEQYYQSVRRCWRFGQKRDVNVVIVTSDAEAEIVDNVRRKEQQAAQLAEGVIEAVKDAQIESVLGKLGEKETYRMKTETGDRWEIKLGDCVERVQEIATGSVGLSVFSPPFAHLYTYSASERDMGNAADYGQFFTHFGFLIPELLRVTAPGRRCCVHVAQLPTTKTTHGVIGWRDFRADVVREFVSKSWVYDGEVVIDKDPQAQAIRTKAKALMFVQKNKDSAWSRPAMADYILLFRAPGDNAEPIKTDVSNNEWIEFARPIWYGIDESDTLNYQVARESADERHICPLQLGTIERCVRLWSNRGDLVLSPFAGIGSEGFVSLQHGRRFIGIELKESYFNQAVKNLKAAVKQESLFAA